MIKTPRSPGDALKVAEVAIDGLNAIAELVGGATAANAAGVITVVKVVLSTVREGLEGPGKDIDPEAVRESLAKFTTDLGSNDSAADKRLANKFGE